VQRELPVYKFNYFEEDEEEGEEKTKENTKPSSLQHAASVEVDKTCTAHRQERPTYRGFVEKCEESPLGRHKRRWEDSIKRDLNEIASHLTAADSIQNLVGNPERQRPLCNT
jgi:hypothetical protein